MRLVLAAIVLAGCTATHTPAADGEVPSLDASLDTNARVRRDVGADGNDACSVQGRFSCIGGGRVCCGGRLREFSDGPCAVGFGPEDAGHDASGDVDAWVCATDPVRAGCPCEVGGDAGQPVCWLDIQLECVEGTWLRTDILCTFCAHFGP